MQRKPALHWGDLMRKKRVILLIAVCYGIFSLLIFVSPSLSEQPEQGLKLIEAIGTTLSNQPSIKIQEEVVEISKGALQQASGAFDPTLTTDISRTHENKPFTAADQLTYGTSKDASNVTTYTVSLNKKLRNGITVGPNAQMTRTDDQSSGAPTINEGSVNFVITLPLLSGRGRESAAAGETAAKSQVEASELTLRHTYSTAVLETANAYWEVTAANENLEVLEEAESRSIKLLQDVEKLVNADERPRSDLDQLRADLASKTMARIMGEQTLYEARQHLGIAMGLRFDDVTTLPLPSDTFPGSLSGKSLSIENNKMEFIQLSNKNRSDLLALEKLEKEAMILLTAARINTKPQLDLSLSMGYQSLDETNRKSGYYNAFRENVEGLNGGATLSLQYPFGNNASSGLLHQRKSSHLKTRIQTADLERKIHSYVVVAIHALIQKTAELGEAQKAVLYSRKALNNEKLKLNMGMSTVIDVLDIEDRFRTALQGKVSAQKEYALAVLQLRFATGTLLGEDKGCYTVTTEQLTTIPIP